MPKGSQYGKQPTMRDVADEAGVSKALVSIVFRGVAGASEETRARVFAAADRLGYRPNRTASLLAMGRNRQVGVVMDLHNSFHAELIDAAVLAAEAHRYRLVLSPWTTGRTEEQAVVTALEFRCEALLLLGTSLDSQTIIQLAGTTPIVSVGRAIDLVNVDVVRGAEDLGMAQVVDHLVDLGHRNIVHVDGGADPIAASRRTGFEQSLARHGLLNASVTVRGGRTESDGSRAVRKIVRQPELPTAIAAFNDHCALGVIDGLARAGLRVPQDISVTGYDDTPLAGLAAINLTSVRQDAVDFASWAVTAVVERLDAGRTLARESVLVPQLIARGTTGAPTRASPSRRIPEASG